MTYTYLTRIKAVMYLLASLIGCILAHNNLMSFM